MPRGIPKSGARADRPLPRPFIKWAGGKSQLIDALAPHLPAEFGTYHEPFVGAGALFFALSRVGRLRRAVLSDTNTRLLATWRGVRDSVEPLIERLASMPYDKDLFLAQRARAIDGEDDLEIATWFIYLNKTGFNGLYRVNRSGQFNVPFGRYDNPNICDAPALRAASRALQGVEICREDFSAVLDRAQPGDLVYFDPPYVPLSQSSSFTAYTQDGFTLNDQRRLHTVASRLKARGVHVLLSNSSSPSVDELYAEGFTVHRVPATRSINSKGDARGPVDELIII